MFAPDHARALHDVEADAAESPNTTTLAPGLYLGRVDDRADARW
jgi:hypothetical protein